MGLPLNIKLMQSVAEHKGGKCLSKEYISNHSPLQWMCKKGHTWDAPYSIIQQGGWCRQCIKNSDHLATCQEIAAKKGGKCLSENYVNSETKLKWECKNGHTWLTTPHIIKTGAWCATCYWAEQKIIEFNKLKEKAKKHGVICLSENFGGKNSKLKWQCSKGHKWLAQARHVGKGKQCKVCIRLAVCEKELQKLKAFAKKKGGECVSDTFTRIDRRMKWKCGKGHAFTATAKQIKSGSWCITCSRKYNAESKRKYTVSDLKEYAKSKGGKMLSNEYINYMKPVTWQCDKGHKWDAIVLSVVEKGTWCRKCNTEKHKLSIDDFHKIAKERNGELLSKKYVTGRTPLKWKCDKKHVWMAAPADVKRGSWCPICAYVKRGNNSRYN